GRRRHRHRWRFGGRLELGGDVVGGVNWIIVERKKISLAFLWNRRVLLLPRRIFRAPRALDPRDIVGFGWRLDTTRRARPDQRDDRHLCDQLRDTHYTYFTFRRTRTTATTRVYFF